MFDSRLAIVAISTGTTAATGVALAPEHLTFVAGLVGLVGVVAGLVAWIDSRIEKQIKSHSEKDIERHNAVLNEIAHLREMLDLPRQTPVPFREGEG